MSKVTSKAFAIILEELNSQDKEIRLPAWDKFAAYGGDDVQFYIDILSFDRSECLARNVAAEQLARLKDQRAYYPLLSFIMKPENINYNGSMVYALAQLDCSAHLLELFEILFYHESEAKWNVQYIIREQTFEIKTADLILIDAMWEGCKRNPELCPGFDTWSESIQSDVDGFLEYLDE